MNTLSYERAPEDAEGQIRDADLPAAPAPRDPRMTRRDVGLLVEVTQAAKLLTVGALTFGLTMTVCWQLRHQESIFAALASI